MDTVSLYIFFFLSFVYAFRAAVYTLLRPIVFFSSLALRRCCIFIYCWAFVCRTRKLLLQKASVKNGTRKTGEIKQQKNEKQ